MIRTRAQKFAPKSLRENKLLRIADMIFSYFFFSPSRSGLVKGLRFGVRAGTALATLPLENQKSLYNSLLLQCDRVQIDIERL